MFFGVPTFVWFCAFIIVAVIIWITIWVTLKAYSRKWEDL